MKQRFTRLGLIWLVAFALCVAPVMAKSSSSGSSSSRSSSSRSSSSSSRSSSGSGFSSSGKSSSSSSSGSGFSSSGKSSSASDSGTKSSSAASKPSDSSTKSSTSDSSSKSSTASSKSDTTDSASGKSAFSSSGRDKSQTSSAATKTSLQSKADSAVQQLRSQQALNKYKENRQKFQAPPSTVASSAQTQASVLNNVRTNSGTTRVVTVNHYYLQRDDFYNRYSYSTPSWAYRSSPSFGMWDAMFLWFMLDHINDRQYSSMYYHHYDDPAIQAWRREADTLARDNADLRAKLATLDSSQQGFANVQRDPSYLPQEVGATALSAEQAERVFAREKSGFSLLNVFFWMGIFGFSLALACGIIWAIVRFVTPKKEGATI